MKSHQDTIAITVDKSHLITIGEQLYSRRVELIRELTNDADATEVWVEVKDDRLVVRDNGLGMESWGKEMARVVGEVNADFLPITSDRAGFVTDSEEYIAFDKVMRKVIKDVRKVLGKLSDQKETKRARRALRDALQRVQQVLRQNPEFSPFGILPVAEKEDELGKAGVVQPKEEEKEQPLLCTWPAC